MILFFLAILIGSSMSAGSNMIDLSSAWNNTGRDLKLSDMYKTVTYSLVNNKGYIAPYGKTEVCDNVLLNNQQLYHKSGLLVYFDFRDPNKLVRDDGLFQHNNAVYYYQFYGEKLYIYDKNGFEISQIELPPFVDRIQSLPNGLLLGYRTKSINITDKGLPEYCIISPLEKKILNTVYSLSEKDAVNNKLWYPLMFNTAWVWQGKTFFYCNVTNEVSEIIPSENSLNVPLYSINKSPYSIDYPLTIQSDPDKWKMGENMNIIEIKESGSYILFKVSFKNEMQWIAYNKNTNEAFKVNKIISDIDGIADGNCIYPYEQLDNGRKELLRKEFKDRLKNNSVVCVFYL